MEQNLSNQYNLLKSWDALCRAHNLLEKDGKTLKFINLGKKTRLPIYI